LKIWILGLAVLIITGFFIFKKAKKEADEHAASEENAKNMTTTTIIQSPVGATLYANPLPPGVNDTNWPYWRTDLNPVMAPLIDQFNAYQPYNLNPIYTQIGVPGGNSGYYESIPASAYYYAGSRVPDFLLPQQNRWNILQTRYEQALYGNLNRSWDLTDPVQRQ
jgi:hypothetical protein